jgi:hypothetical protein
VSNEAFAALERANKKRSDGEAARQKLKDEGEFKPIKMHYRNLLGTSVDIYHVPEICVERGKRGNLICPHRVLKDTIRAGETKLILSIVDEHYLAITTYPKEVLKKDIHMPWSLVNATLDGGDYMVTVGTYDSNSEDDRVGGLQVYNMAEVDVQISDLHGSSIAVIPAHTNTNWWASSPPFTFFGGNS